MKIDKIKKLSSGKYKIELDNKEKIITYDDVIINNNLLFNKNVDSEKLNIINLDTKYYDVYNKVIKYISIRFRSEKEIVNYLEKLNVIEEDKNKIIDTLKENNLINDNLFCKLFINDKINLTNQGLNKIKSELLEHNISEEILDNEINNIDRDLITSKIDKYISKKASLNKKNSSFLFKQKMINELTNLGYDYSDIISSLEKINFNNDIILKNYEVVYNKLKNKYSGSELDLKVRQKLYQKGFSKEEIDNIKTS